MVLGSLPVQAKTRLYSNTGIASTACVMTQGEIASTAYGHPQAEFSQIFPVEYLQKLACIRGIVPLAPFAKTSKLLLENPYLHICLIFHLEIER